MRKFILFLLTLSYVSSFATNIFGGEITWKCMGNGQIVFQLALYNECDTLAPALSDTVYLTSNASGLDSIMVVRDLLKDIDLNPGCYLPGGGIECNVQGVYPTKKSFYYSDTLIVSGAPPSSGWYFEYTDCCRAPVLANTSSSNLYLRSVMYPYEINGMKQNVYPCYDSSPQFEDVSTLFFGTGIDHNLVVSDIGDHDLDSVKVGWAEAMASGPYPGTPVTYNTGYSYDKPLPDTTQDVSNYLSQLDQVSGRLKFRSFTTGTFVTTIRISSFKEGQLVSEVYRDMPYTIVPNVSDSGLCNQNPNSPPSLSVFVDTLISNTNLYPVLNKGGDTLYYRVEAMYGEEIRYRVDAVEFDLHPSNCIPQDIRFTASGLALEKNAFYGNNRDCAYPGSCAEFVSLNGNGTFTSKLTNHISFKWQTDSINNFPAGKTNYHFVVKMQDDNCQVPAASAASVIVNLNKPIALSSIEERICYGDSTQITVSGDTTNLLWSPSAGVSDVNSANPDLYPMQTTVYKVIDQNTGFKQYIEVIVDSLVLPTIIEQNGTYIVSNSENWDTLIWRLNGAPLQNGKQPLTPMYTGSYYVEATLGACNGISNVLDTAFNNSISLTALAQKKDLDTHPYQASYGMNITNSGNSYLHVTDILLSASATVSDTPSFFIEIFDNNKNKVFSSDSIELVDDNLVKLKGTFTLDPNEDYFISLYADGVRIINLFEPINWPVQEITNNIWVYNASRDFGYVQFPSTVSNTYPFLHFLFDGSISIEENSRRNWTMYPNPVNNILHFSQTGDYKIFDQLGRVVLEMQDVNEIDVSLLASGVYFVQSEEIVEKLIKQ